MNFPRRDIVEMIAAQTPAGQFPISQLPEALGSPQLAAAWRPETNTDLHKRTAKR
jgi:hypothetical protein